VTKKSILPLIVIAFLAGTAAGQEVIRNPARPPAGNAGRIVSLKPETMIIDTGTEFYFKSPRSPRISPDGSFFVQDIDQLLEFDSSGRFVRNYLKKGQGPGEAQGIYHYLLADGRVFLQDMYGGKILVFDKTGTCLKEFRISAAVRSPRLLDLRGGRFLLTFLRLVPGGEAMSIEQGLATMADSGDDWEEKISFPVRGTARETGGISAAVITASLTAVSHPNGLMVVSHTPEYLVKVIDVDKGRLVRTFTREYAREPQTDASGPKIKMSGQAAAGPPPSKYKNDIAGLFVQSEDIWVVTSSFDRDKGTLVDVFDIQGRYRDSFRLRCEIDGRPVEIKGRDMNITGKAIVFLAKRDDETFVLVKCTLPK